MKTYINGTILALLATALLLSSCDHGSRQAFADSLKNARQAHKK